MKPERDGARPGLENFQQKIIVAHIDLHAKHTTKLKSPYFSRYFLYSKIISELIYFRYGYRVKRVGGENRNKV